MRFAFISLIFALSTWLSEAMETEMVWCPERSEMPGYFTLPFWPTEYQMQVTMVLLSVSLVQIILAVYTLYPQYLHNFLKLSNWIPQGPQTDMRRYIGWYLLITVSYSMALIWQMSYFVVVFATIHNWFEWQILGVAYFGLDNSKRRNGCCFSRRAFNIFAFLFIFGMVQISSLNIPNMAWGHQIVQLTGLYCDNQLALVGLYKLLTSKDKRLYGKFFIATVLHCTMIAVLFFMIAGHISKYPVGTTLICIVLYGSVINYALFALEFDSKHNAKKQAAIESKESAMVEMVDCVSNDEDTDGAAFKQENKATSSSVRWISTTPNVGGVKANAIEEMPEIAEKERVDEVVPCCAMFFIMVLGFCIAVGMVIVAIVMLPVCPAMAAPDVDSVHVSYRITTYGSLADELRDDLLAMKSEALQDSGNQWFRVFEGAAGDFTQGNMFEAAGFVKFVVYEKWSDESAHSAFIDTHKENFYFKAGTVTRPYHMMNPEENPVLVPETQGLVANYVPSDIDANSVCLSNYQVGMMTMTLNPMGYHKLFSSLFVGVAVHTRAKDYTVMYLPMVAAHEGIADEDIRDFAVIEAYQTTADFYEHFLTHEVTEFSLFMYRALMGREYHGPLKELDMFTYC